MIMGEWSSNPHGGGIAYIEKNPRGKKGQTKALRHIKGIMDKKAMRKTLTSLIGDTVVAHVRYATNGEQCKENTHPFPTCRGTAVMFHNGILPSPWSSSSQVSDSMLLAKTLYPLDMTEVLADQRDIEKTLGWNKLVFLTRTGVMHVINDHMGEWLGEGKSTWVSKRISKTAKVYGKSGKQTCFGGDQWESHFSEDAENNAIDQWQGDITSDSIRTSRYYVGQDGTVHSCANNVTQGIIE